MLHSQGGLEKLESLGLILALPRAGYLTLNFAFFTCEADTSQLGEALCLVAASGDIQQ